MLLEIQHISFTFPGKNHLIDDISISLEKGRIYALMGANGAGKTTLFNLISGFIKPYQGSIKFKEKEISGLKPHQINNSGISRTFQDLRLISKLTVKENVVLCFKNNPSDRLLNALLPPNIIEASHDSLSKRADEILSRFFLEEVKYQPAGEISYGQQKLLTLACCVANDADLLLLDEPVAGINPNYRDKILSLIKDLRNEGKTVLLIEHNPEFLSEVSEELFFLAGGKILAFDNYKILRENEIVINSYM
jgi:ABC-type branched-subunit amino acid transport system ATPase component